MADYFRPASLDEALAALTRPWTVLAGGTDFYPARVGRAIDENVLDITGITNLRGISAGPEGWRLGATTTWAELIETPLPAKQAWPWRTACRGDSDAGLAVDVLGTEYSVLCTPFDSLG